MYQINPRIQYRISANVTSGVYKILTNDNYYYVGASKNLLQRYKSHQRKLKANVHENKHMQNRYNAHIDNIWTFELVEEVNSELLFLREQYYLNQAVGAKNCMNCSSLALQPPNPKGRKYGPRPQEVKEKIRNGNRGKIPWNRGKPGTMLGKKLTSISKTKRALSRLLLGTIQKTSVSRSQLHEVIQVLDSTDTRLDIALVLLCY